MKLENIINDLKKIKNSYKIKIHIINNFKKNKILRNKKNIKKEYKIIILHL